jgi:hypothetical protein
MRRTPDLNRLDTLARAAMLLLGVLTAASAHADQAQEASVTVRLKVVSACTIDHLTSVAVRCTPGTPTPAIVPIRPPLAAPARASTTRSDAHAGATRIDIVF